MIKYLLISTILSGCSQKNDTIRYSQPSVEAIEHNSISDSMFYKHMKGKIDNKMAVMDLIYVKNEGIKGFYTYIENPKPIFFMMRNDSLKFTFQGLDFNLEKRLFFKGILTDNKVSGKVFEKGKENEIKFFEFNSCDKGEYIDFEVLSLSNDLCLRHKKDYDKSTNAFLKLVCPYSITSDFMNQKLITEILYLKKYDKETDFEFNIKKQAEFFFKDDVKNLQELSNENSYRDYNVTIAHNSNAFVSFYLIKEFDIFRKQDCLGNGFVYDVRNNKRILFENIFKGNSKTKIKKLIKEKFYLINEKVPFTSEHEKINAFKDFEKDMENYDFNNFLMSDGGISFIYFGYIDRRLRIPSGQHFFLNYKTIKDLILTQALPFFKK